MAYWLVKSEPEEYSFAQLMQEGVARWDGVRNPQAQKYLRAMQVGDLVLYYHTGAERAIVGLAEVVRAAYPDPADPRYGVVDLRAVRPFSRPLTLQAIRKEPLFSSWALVRQPRLSVMPVPESLWQVILARVD